MYELYITLSIFTFLHTVGLVYTYIIIYINFLIFSNEWDPMTEFNSVDNKTIGTNSVPIT